MNWKLLFDKLGRSEEFHQSVVTLLIRINKILINNLSKLMTVSGLPNSLT